MSVQAILFDLDGTLLDREFSQTLCAVSESVTYLDANQSGRCEAGVNLKWLW
ncbi:hypothetical protein [Brevibacillus centrosporus]|uniref:hypothetical protein n=1 Tax=Brevibacillus centrosporus TaxID=54910 RepID=UPI00382F44E1